MAAFTSTDVEEMRKKFEEMERENDALRKENQDKKNENEAFRKKDQENLEKIKELEDEKQKKDTNLWGRILRILQDKVNKIIHSHPVLTIVAAVEGFSLDLENHGKVFVQGEVPEPYQGIALEIVNGVVSVIRGVINCIKSFFQYLLEWFQGKLAIKNE